MSSLKKYFSKQPVYAGFIATLIIVSVAIAYFSFISVDSSTYYSSPQVKGVIVTRPLDSGKAGPEVFVPTTQSSVVVKESKEDVQEESESVELFSSIIAVDTIAPTTTVKWSPNSTTTTTRLSTTTTLRKPRRTTTTTSTTLPDTTTTVAPSTTSPEN